MTSFAEFIIKVTYYSLQVYTVGNESQNLLVFGVPKINLYQELKRKLQRYGSVEHIRNITTEWVERPNAEPLEAFTEVFSVKYRKPEQARFCKHYMDAKEFYGGILHISYAPENETVDELRSKLLRRQFEINQRLDINQRQKRALNKAAKKATTGSIFTCTLTPATINFSKNKHPRKTFKS